jgi:DNA-binding transcriptional ArsR family regulator
LLVPTFAAFGVTVGCGGFVAAEREVSARALNSLVKRRRLRIAGTDQLSAVFSALSDPTRRAIIAELAARDATVTELTAPLSISMPAVSRHLKVLERAALISRSRSFTSATALSDSDRQPCPVRRRLHDADR